MQSISDLGCPHLRHLISLNRCRDQIDCPYSICGLTKAQYSIVKDSQLINVKDLQNISNHNVPHVSTSDTNVLLCQTLEDSPKIVDRRYLPELGGRSVLEYQVASL